MSDSPDHHCPGCGAAQRAFLRYPWYFCRDCLKQAVDGSGRALEFGNVSFGGGFCWRYADEPAGVMRVCLGVICLIHGRPAYVSEARFGGIVAEPATSPGGIERDYQRLTGQDRQPPPG